MKEELMSQDDEEDIPVTEREMNLKVTIHILLNFSDAMNLIFHKNAEAHCFRVSHQTGTWICSEKPKQGLVR